MLRLLRVTVDRRLHADRRRGRRRHGRRGHQGLEQHQVIGFLGVPLHADAEGMALQFHALHHLIRGPCHGEEPAADPVDRLMVRARHVRRAGVERTPDPARGTELHIVGRQLHRVRLVAVIADAFGQVLGQRAAAGQVQHVHTAADRQERQVRVDDRPHDRQLEPVTPVIRRLRLLVRLLVVQRRVEVPATGEHHAVQRGDQAGHRVSRHRRQHHRRPPGPFDRARISDRRDHSLANPVAPASRL